ncbi:nuclear receptor subfamily 1 group I member 2 isoform X1 [Salmo salar]|uniref:Nuclear receptor subfamily 1 group I member 2 n=2 Tax=Salmo salar TaxID=8030 RepID=A0A1S3PQW0_SALSA|nr:nuclear receptor subfamily 1 group I member 2 isoform X1 [Salmo salar]|eukprot:XP_014029639.1 PREDICTED: nuclear receptor subfamily 1 group I member 2-like isoform X3 [Salmo salar]
MSLMSKENLSDWPSSQTSAEEEEDEEDDGEPKVCQVCGDRATGYHFNAMTCEGCKGFFRRAMKHPTKFCCPWQGACVITKNNRRQCQACRLHKCQSIGMLKELIMSKEAVEKRRSQIRRNRMVEEPPVLSPQQEAVIQELFNAHEKTFDITFSHFQFRPIDRDLNPMSVWNQTATGQSAKQTRRMDNLSSSYSTSTSTSFSSSSCSLEDEEDRSDGGKNMVFTTLPDVADLTTDMEQEKEKKEDRSDGGKNTVFTTLPHIADLTTYMIQNIINFAKGLPSFRALAIDDQISLLKGAMFEMMQIRFNMMFNVKTGIWECGPLTYCMDDAVRAGFQRHLLDPLMRFHYSLRNLQLQEVEYVLMQAISLFSPDRPGVINHGVIDSLQEKLAIALKVHIDSKRARPEKHLLYPKILACLTEMRTMNEEYTKQVLQIQDIQPGNSFDPLILEVVSKDP